MSRFWKLAPWLIRLSLLPPTIILALIAYRYIAHPIDSAAAQGIVLPAGLGVTIARVGLGRFPLGCSIFLATCLLSSRRCGVGFASGVNRRRLCSLSNRKHRPPNFWANDQVSCIPSLSPG
jgi:hypothetical protein